MREEEVFARYLPKGKMSENAMKEMRKDISGFRYGNLVTGLDTTIEGHFVDADAVYHLWEWKNILQKQLQEAKEQRDVLQNSLNLMLKKFGTCKNNEEQK